MKNNYNIAHIFRILNPKFVMLSEICNLRQKSCEFQIRKQFIAILLMCFVGLQAVAQQFFPVVARFTQLPPYPVYLADFSNPSQTNLSIQVQQNDRDIASRAFRIKVYIEGQGFQIQGADVVQGENPLTLTYGQVYNLPASDVANYFKQYNLKVSPDQYRRPFSEGSFRFGVEIIDDITKRPLSGIQWANPVWITINEPPVWVMPQNNITVTPTVPQNITFQWAPRHTNVSDVEYEFIITDLMVNKGFTGNIQNLFLAQPAFYKTRTRSTTLSYNATLPPLVPGRMYAYRVEAIAKRGREDVGVFRNNGFTEIQYFSYGDPLLPPTNLKLAWDGNNNKEANFNWKGESTHKSFVLELREKGGKGDWKSSNIAPLTGNQFHAFKFENLDPTKNYEARVTGVGADGQRATSTITDLTAAPLPTKIDKKYIIKGKVQWAYRSSEENLQDKDNNNKIVQVSGDQKDRQIKQENVNNTAGSQLYALKNANVILFSSDEEITVENYKLREEQKMAFRITTVTTNASGEFSIEAKGLKLMNLQDEKVLTAHKRLYAIAEYNDNVFQPVVMSITIPSNPDGFEKDLGNLTVLANTIRYAPKLNTKGTLDLEEIAVYRLKNVIDNDKFSYLKEEGNTSSRTTLAYNNDTYIKVGDLTNSFTAGQLFSNKPYNDKFVLRVKERNKRAVVFPINSIDKFEQGKYAQITDYFNYMSPNNNPIISGYVERDNGGKKERVKNAGVRALGYNIKTDDNGYYEIELPSAQTLHSKIEMSAVDPLNTNNIEKATVVYDRAEMTQNFVLSGMGHLIAGRVFGTDKTPISGASVTYRGKTAKTNSDGFFNIVGTNDEMKKDSVAVSFDGYETTKAGAGSFKLNTFGIDVGANERKANVAIRMKGNLTNEDKEKFYLENFTQPQITPASTYETDSIFLTVPINYRIIAYSRKKNGVGFANALDSMIVVPTVLKIDDNEKEVPQGKMTFDGGKEVWMGGYVDKTSKKELTINVVNKKGMAGRDTLYTPEYVEEEIKFNLPKKYTKETVVFKVRLKPAQYFYGTVYDSTTFIAGVHSADDTLTRNIGGVRRPLVRRAGSPFFPLDSVEVSASGSKGISNNKGHFRLLVPQGEEFELELSRKLFTTSKYGITVIQAKEHLVPDNGAGQNKGRRSLYIQRQDKNIPEFKTLMGFDIKVDKAVRQSSVAFMISGTLYLNKGRVVTDAKTNIFSAVDDNTTKELTFKNIVVKKDTKKETNAITLLSSINFVETEAKIKLFGYAPITMQGRFQGEPFIRLQHLDMKGGAAASDGKIGASEMEFTQREMMGINFGKMELSVKAPEKEGKFNKINDKISDKDAIKREEQYKADKATAEESVKKAQIAAAKDAAENLKGKEKEKAEKQADAIGNTPTAVPEKEPMLLAFAPSNLEELADTKEFKIEFPEHAKKGNTKNFGGNKDSTNTDKKGLEKIQKAEETYANFIKIPIGTTVANAVQQQVTGKVEGKTDAGKAAVKAGNAAVNNLMMAALDPETVVLKKSGVSMKGILLFPQIWRFVSDGKPLTFEKLEIDKKFELKTAIIGKSDKDKKHIKKFGVADKWMCYLNNIQIYNNFKGYGIGGTFNTDKENFININSLGFSLIDKQVYPNVDLSTPEGGFRFSKVRFKTMGKKSITIKGNPDDKSYEVEGSLRIEWDESEIKTSETDSTDRFGKKLTDEQKAGKLMEKQNTANEAEQKELAEKRETKKAEEDLKKAVEDAKKNLSNIEDKFKVAQDDYMVASNALGAINTKKDKLKADDPQQPQLQVQLDAAMNVLREKNAVREALRNQLEPLQTKLKLAEDAIKIAAANKEVEDNKKKIQDAKDADKKAADKIAAKAKDDAAKAAVEKGEQREIKSKDASSPDWKKRIFPIEVQVFKWSTSGKFLISAKPSDDALKFGPVAIKIRRIVYSRGAAIKQSEINDLLKMSEDEIKKINSTGKFNDSNTYVDKDGKRIGATSAESQASKEGATVESFNVKGIEDKVAAENPSTTGWAFGFAGGVEVETKSINIDSDASFFIADFDNKGYKLVMNEILLKIDATSFKAYAKVKLGTSGKKIGFEGEGEFEGAKLKAAISLKYYSLFDDKGAGTGVELGAALKISTGPSGIPMGPITWTALGGGFDLNTADKKFAIFFLGDARTTGVPEDFTAFKKIKVSLEFDGKNCGAAPVIKGYAEWWSAKIQQEKVCDLSIEIDFCKTRVIAKMNCDLTFSEKKVAVNALVIMSPSAGIFLGAKVRANLFDDATLNGLLVLGIDCDTQDPNAQEVANYNVPAFLFKSDGRKIMGIYVGLDASIEKTGSGGTSVFGIDVVSYYYEMKFRGKLNLGINFANADFIAEAMLALEAEGKASVLGFRLGGKLNLQLELAGGKDRERGMHFRAIAAGKLELGAGEYDGKDCNSKAIFSFSPYIKICVEGRAAAFYQQRGPDNLRGWRGSFGGDVPTPPRSYPVYTSVKAGAVLNKGEAKFSPNRIYRLAVEDNGNVVLYKNDIKIGETLTGGKGVVKLKVQNDGNLVAYDQSEKAIWATGTNGKGGSSTTLVVQDDGDVVLIDGGNTFWQTNTKNVFTQAEVTNSTLKAEQSLTADKREIYSGSKKYKLALQSDGDVVFLNNNEPIWSANTTGQKIDAFKLQNDGNLVAYAPGGVAKWKSETNGKGNGDKTTLLVQEDGNLVVYKSINEITPFNVKVYQGVDAIWANGTAGGKSEAEKKSTFPKEASILASRGMKRGETITSANGKYKFTLQNDGNAIIYKGNAPIWKTNTTDIDILKVQPDGNLVGYTTGGDAKWAAGTQGQGDKSCVLGMQDDGNLVLYKNGKEAIWSSKTSNAFTLDEIGENSLLKNEETLRIGEKRTSSKGTYKLEIAADKDVVLYRGNDAIWSANTTGQDIDAFKVQNDGNLVAYAVGRRDRWSSGTRGKGGDKTTLVLQEDGNMVLYKKLEKVTPGHIEIYRAEGPIWTSETWGGKSRAEVENPYPAGASLIVNKGMKRGSSISSPNGKYRFTLQNDGNVVIYKGDAPIWALNRADIELIKIQADGNIVGYDAGNKAQWSSGSNGRGDNSSTLVMQDNGDLVLLKADKSVVWRSQTNGAMALKEISEGAILSNEQTLRRGESRTSKNGTYTLTMDEGYDIVVKKGSMVVWRLKLGLQNIDGFKMQRDGNLVAYAVGANAKWSSQTTGKGGDQSGLILEDDGSLVLYKTLTKRKMQNVDFYCIEDPIWSSGKPSDTEVSAVVPDDYLTTDAIRISCVNNETNLTANDSRTSPNGTYRLTVQADGNVVLYKGSSAIWSTGTNGKGVNDLKVQSDGNLVAYASGSNARWDSNTNGRGGNETILVLQNDGNLVLYKSLEKITMNGRDYFKGKDAIWSSGTAGK